MKSRIIFGLLLLVALFILVTRSNNTVQDFILDKVSPIKKYYKIITRSAKDRGDSYIFQKESIQKLTKENKVLRKYLLDQTNYLQQVSSLYKKIPSLEKLPHKSTELVNTISYVRLNSFNEVLLDRPKKAKLEEGQLYGLVQNDVVGGTAVLRGDHLYGYLTSNPLCRFGVFIGESRSPGIAVGVDKDTMVVKYIPKWSKVEVGDKVETSGLDGIFFANLPAGVVKEVKIENSFKTAYIKTYNDTLHPNYFFMITDPKPYLVSAYDKNNTNLDSNQTIRRKQHNKIDKQTISSIPETIQTKESTVDPAEFEIPKEEAVTPAPKPPVVFHHPKPKQKKTKPKRKSKPVVKSKPKPKEEIAVEETPQEEPKPVSIPEQKPKKRKSAMDFINGR